MLLDTESMSKQPTANLPSPADVQNRGQKAGFEY